MELSSEAGSLAFDRDLPLRGGGGGSVWSFTGGKRGHVRFVLSVAVFLFCLLKLLAAVGCRHCRLRGRAPCCVEVG